MVKLRAAYITDSGVIRQRYSREFLRGGLAPQRVRDIIRGEVLAMANSPAYNPNNLGNTSKDVMRNRAITDIFEPGSTVKPMVVMTALQRGVIREGSVINTVPYRGPYLSGC